MMLELEYLTDKHGQPKAVIIPIEVWKSLFSSADVSVEELVEEIENHCLNRAMDEAAAEPLLNRMEALAYLEE